MLACCYIKEHFLFVKKRGRRHEERKCTCSFIYIPPPPYHSFLPFFLISLFSSLISFPDGRLLFFSFSVVFLLLNFSGVPFISCILLFIPCQCLRFNGWFMPLPPRIRERMAGIFFFSWGSSFLAPSLVSVVPDVTSIVRSCNAVSIHPFSHLRWSSLFSWSLFDFRPDFFRKKRDKKIWEVRVKRSSFSSCCLVTFPSPPVLTQDPRMRERERESLAEKKNESKHEDTPGENEWMNNSCSSRAEKARERK